MSDEVARGLARRIAALHPSMPRVDRTPLRDGRTVVAWRFSDGSLAEVTVAADGVAAWRAVSGSAPDAAFRLLAATAVPAAPTSARPAALADGAWRGERVFVVADGPSLRMLAWERLRDERVVALNGVGLLAGPRTLAPAVVTLVDDEGVRERVIEDPPGPVLWLRDGRSGDPPGCVAVGRSVTWSRGLDAGLAVGDVRVAALNLADVLLDGDGLVYLVGFDGAWGEPGLRADLERYAPACRARVVDLSSGSGPAGPFPRDRLASVLAASRPLVVSGYQGLGDTVYFRPYVRALAEARPRRDVYVRTSWPQLLADLPVRFLRPTPRLRTQDANVERQPASTWAAEPADAEVRRPQFGLAEYRAGLTILEAFGRSLGGLQPPPDFALSVPAAWRAAARAQLAAAGLAAGRAYALVHPATIRREWPAPGRNPAPGLVAAAVAEARRAGLALASVAWLADGEEWATEAPLDVDVRLERGELALEELVGAVAEADLVIAPQGFLFPLATACHTPLVALFGGVYPPRQVFDPRMGLERVRVVAPEPFCACLDRLHDCPRAVPEARARTAVRELVRTRAEARRTLLLVRCGPALAGRLARNEGVRRRWRVVALGQDPIDDYLPHLADGTLEAVHEDRPWDGAVERSERYLAALLRGWRPEAIVAAQPLQWYSEAVARVAEREGVSVVWLETWLDDRVTLDRVGAHYAADNEVVRFAGAAPALPGFEPPVAVETKYPAAQPPERPRVEVLSDAGLAEDAAEPVVVLGQAPADMSLVRAPGPGYLAWLDLLFRANPGTTFLFKHHPQARTPHLERYPNVRAIDEAVVTLLRGFRLFAAFSSTTIVEAVLVGRAVATGGYHVLRDPRIVLPVERGRDARRLAGRLAAFRRNLLATRRRLAFLFGRYAVRPEDPRLVERLTTSSERWHGVEGP